MKNLQTRRPVHGSLNADTLNACISSSLRKYKFAVEEKEAAVSEAMGRYRKMQRELEDAEERAERAEGTASTLRARSIRSVNA